MWLDKSCAANFMDSNKGYVKELDKVPSFPSGSFYQI